MSKQQEQFTLIGSYDEYQKAISELGNLIAVLDGLSNTDFRECPLETANYAIAGAKTILLTAFDVLTEMQRGCE